MPRTHLSSWVVGLISILVISLLIFLLKPRSKEHFEVSASSTQAPDVSLNPIDSTLMSTVYQKTGIDRCEALYAGITSDMRDDLTEKATATMDNFVLGHRIREWIPVDNKVKKNYGDGKQCYILFDCNNDAIDPILQDATCDMRNPIFQGVEFIRKVSVDSNVDSVHTLPYSKCIIDINQEDVNSSTLNYFWSRMGEAQCSNYQKGAQSEVHNLVKTVTACNNELKAFKDLDPKYKKCMEDQRRLEGELAERIRLYTLSNCAFAGNCDSSQGSLLTMEERLALLTRQIRESKDRSADLDKSIAEMQRKTRIDERRLNEMNIVYTGLSNDYVRCQTTDQPQTMTQLQEVQDETARLTNTSNILAKQYKLCQENRSAKKREYENIITSINRAKGLYAGLNSDLVTCLSTNDYLRQTITTLKDQVQKFMTATDECTSTVVMRIAERDSLVQDVMNLTQERDEWLRRCTYDQKKMMDSSVQAINNLRSSSTQYTRQNCGNDMQEAEAVNDLIKQKFEAIAQAQQPIKCTDPGKREQCCKNIGLE